MHTIWKPIPGLPEYEVSDDGRVRFSGGLRRFGARMRYAPPSERKPQPHSGGYLQIRIRAMNIYVHRLVAQAFVPPVEGCSEVNHINGDKTDNRAANLEWVTRSLNLRHATRVLNRAKHARTGRKPSPEEIAAIRKATGPAKQVAAQFGVSAARVYRLRKELSDAGRL